MRAFKGKIDDLLADVDDMAASRRRARQSAAEARFWFRFRVGIVIILSFGALIAFACAAGVEGFLGGIRL